MSVCSTLKIGFYFAVSNYNKDLIRDKWFIWNVSETLEVLVVLDFFGSQSVTCRLPKLQQLMISYNEEAVNHLKSKCPPDCKVITNSSAAIQKMTKNAEHYTYPPIAGCYEEIFIFYGDVNYQIYWVFIKDF